MNESTDNNSSEKVMVEIKNLTKIFGSKPEKADKYIKEGLSKKEIFEKTGQNVALKDLNFEVYSGDIFVLMGLSGCGKSTLLRCINRLITPEHGQIIIDGNDISKIEGEELLNLRRYKIAMIFQSFALLPHKSIIDNVAFGLEIQGVSDEEKYKKAKDAIKLVGLDGYEESRPSELSGGMQQRVGLARALASDPDILLMDEAFSALDPLIRGDMQDELLTLQENLQKTIIFVTHDLDEALKLGTRIALMKDGEILQIGNAEEILTNPANKFVEKFVEGVDMVKVLCASDVMKKPEPLISIDSGPNNALHFMEEFGISSVFVVSKGRKYEGLILAEDATKAKKEGNKLADIIKTDIPVVKTTTSIADIIPVMADSPYPIAVLDENDKMKGIIIKGSLLAALARMEVI
ncbi:glycine betaine/L-proline ABC transporter ATP-binding protein [Methanomicrobium antiquum]|uniref:Glycine betaine/L-proline ABC transporter ATP-binding protein n=1 Tax=Methanomicrobium antiquum TaxID=487686 RepID=A0AAF0FPB1_9EURY|nr:glycine betaine/L-proline ABC transporter ATP-binding protein [Methanomicrobium antiquum]MDD3977765.1 glycine betaine/L-proline ABC transporter ATP-binding protein [Methanomicrobium sp.]WFN37170.1 glycine betaine/L-proline ABC transporter ATP-binding protein [Methanomicrobium antiquum]